MAHPPDATPPYDETLLRDDPQRYAQVVRDVAAFGIYVLDREGTIRSWNLGAYNITGFSEAEVLGKHFSMLFTEAGQASNEPNKVLQFARSNRHHRSEQHRRHKLGQALYALCTLDAVRSASGEIVQYVEVISDLTAIKQREQELINLAVRDPLTGLFNRAGFLERAVIEIDRSTRYHSDPLSVAMLDLDHFKRINDTYGHEAGDTALVAFAKLCSQLTRKVDVVGRMGGEEFALLITKSDKQPTVELMQRLRLQTAQLKMHTFHGQPFSMTVSGGVAAFRPGIKDIQEMLRNADAALYSAKRAGRNRIEAWFE